MSTRVFFYGLYMDTSLLESMGFTPREQGPARLDNFRLVIGERATLVPARGKACHGFVHDLPRDQVSALYSRPEVRGYIPVEVQVTLLADTSVHRAVCYVLPAEEMGSGTNREYANRLATLHKRLGLPSEYAKGIDTLE